MDFQSFQKKKFKFKTNSILRPPSNHISIILKIVGSRIRTFILVFFRGQKTQFKWRKTRIMLNINEVKFKGSDIF